MSLVPSVIVRRWLETVLAAFSLAVIYVNAHREMMRRGGDLHSDANLPRRHAALACRAHRPLGDWLVRPSVFGLMGILGFSAIVVAFFLIYSPIYLVNKLPHLIGQGGWLDQREVRFHPPRLA